MSSIARSASSIPQSRVPAVDLVEIDMVEPEPREAGVDLVQQVVAADPGVVGPFAHRPHPLVAITTSIARDARALLSAPPTNSSLCPAV